MNLRYVRGDHSPRLFIFRKPGSPDEGAVRFFLPENYGKVKECLLINSESVTHSSAWVNTVLYYLDKGGITHRIPGAPPTDKPEALSAMAEY